ncbi:transferase [Ancylobacter sonchi]|nr:transferase [Ancylobacter sonchi]
MARDGGDVASASIAERAAAMAFPRRPPEPASVAALMRSHLDQVRPRSDAEALRILRQAFPAAPLAARVAAMADHRAG